MFADTQQHLEKIISLVKLCPEALQEKCFELLLSAYLNNEIKPQTPAKSVGTISPLSADPATPVVNADGVPDAIKTRFNSLTSRTKAQPTRATALFDFNTDPFTFHAFSIPGSSKREQIRNVALLLSLKSYLTGTSWVADWKEFRAMCLDHNCWDQNNIVNTMKHEWFKVASSADGITLSPTGIQASEMLFAKLSGVSADES